MALGKTEHEASQKLNAQLVIANGNYESLSADHERLKENHNSMTMKLNDQVGFAKGSMRRFLNRISSSKQSTVT